MSQNESNSLTNTTLNSKPTTLQPQASSSTSSKPKPHNPFPNLGDEAERLSPHNPIEIGSRGTVGSLVMKEIEFFNQLEISTRINDTTSKPNRSQTTQNDSVASSSKRVGSTQTTHQKKRKQGRGNRLIPSMCSMVEVSEQNNNSNNSRAIGVSGFGYRSLKADAKNLQA